MKDVNTLLFRCSSLGHLMTEGKGKTNAEKYKDLLSDYDETSGKLALSKSGSKTRENLSEKAAKQFAELEILSKIKDEVELSEGAKTHCIDKMTSWLYDRREEAYGKALDKGTRVEEDSITLVSLQDRKPYWKNEERFENEFIAGTPDLLIKEGDRIMEVDDIKSSYDIFTFMRAKYNDLKPIYYWQLCGYFALTGALKGRIRYCLVNAPADTIEAEKRTLFFRGGFTVNDAEYIEKCIQIERNMIYDMGLFRKQNPEYTLHTDLSTWVYDIPAKDRLFTFEVERNEADIELIAAKVKAAREYIKTKLEGV